MFKRIRTLAIYSILLILCIPFQAKASDITHSILVNPFKTFKIKFNHPITLDKSTNESILVIDDKNNLIPINLCLYEGNTSILVMPPKTGYEIGLNYKLIVKENLHSINGKKLNKENITFFKTQESLSDLQIKNILMSAEINNSIMYYSSIYDKPLEINKKTYLQFKEQFNSKEKLHDFLKLYYTDKMINAIISNLDIHYINDMYYRLETDWHSKVPWDNISIENIDFIDKKTIKILIKENNNFYSNFTNTYVLKYELGKWLIDCDNLFINEFKNTGI